MSTEFPSQWRDVLRRAGIQSYGQLAEKANLPKPTVWAAVTGRSKTYRPATVRGIANAVRRSEGDVTELLGMGRQTVRTYTPPAEAAYLDTRQRAAVDEMIRLLALTPERDAGAEADRADAVHEAEMDAAHQDAIQETREAGFGSVEDYNDAVLSYDEIAQQKAAEALQSDYMPAASPHEQPDPHDDAGENENQEQGENDVR